MSLKDWKQKELNENLNKKWGFKVDLSKLNEGGMPASVVKTKQRYAAMSDKELADTLKGKDDEALKQMAWRHGYGKMSSHYVNRVKKGKAVEEGLGAGVADPMGGQVPWEQEPPMSNQELAIEDCVEQKVAQGMTPCEARPACEQEMGMNAPMEEPVGMQKDPGMPFQENNAMGAGVVQGHTGQKRRTK